MRPHCCQREGEIHSRSKLGVSIFPWHPWAHSKHQPCFLREEGSKMKALPDFMPGSLVAFINPLPAALLELLVSAPLLKQLWGEICSSCRWLENFMELADFCWSNKINNKKNPFRVQAPPAGSPLSFWTMVTVTEQHFVPCYALCLQTWEVGEDKNKRNTDGKSNKLSLQTENPQNAQSTSNIF